MVYPPKTVTHPTTNRAGRRVTWLIRPSMSPLRHAGGVCMCSIMQCLLAPFTMTDDPIVFERVARLVLAA